MERREISCTSPSDVSSKRSPDGVRDCFGRLERGLALDAIFSLFTFFAHYEVLVNTKIRNSEFKSTIAVNMFQSLLYSRGFPLIK